MYHIVYRTTNLLNGKYYIGKHSSKKLFDSYLGSGKRLISAIKKYGKENFQRENLFIFETEKEALLKENEIIETINIPLDEMCYNLCPIGNGRKQIGFKHSEKSREKMKLNSWMSGKTHSPEVRKKYQKQIKEDLVVRKERFCQKRPERKYLFLIKENQSH